MWLCWVFVAARRLSLVAVSGGTLRCGVWASYCSGFSCYRARALGTRASVVVVRWLSSCAARALLLRGMWDLPGPGLEPVSPALPGGFFTTAPPGKPKLSLNYPVCACHVLPLDTRSESDIDTQCLQIDKKKIKNPSR